MENNSFHAVDYVLFAATLSVSMAIGIYYSCTGGKQRTTQEYFLGNRALRTIPVTVSIFMSYISAVLVLGNTAEMFQYGIQYWLAWIGSSLAFLFSAIVFVPFFHKMHLTSSFVYLERRFNSRLIRLWACVMFLISSTVYMGLAMFTPATALEAATGFPVWASIIASGVVGTMYTSLGGMKAVVWTDLFQGVVMLVGILTVLIVGASEVGGLARIWEISEKGGRLNLFNFDPDPTIRLSFWSVILGRFFIGLGVIGTGQPSIQRYSTLKSARSAQTSALLNAPAIAVMYTLTCLCGLTVYAYYENKGCDPLENDEITSSNQYLPYFVMEVVNYPGIPGTFLAVLFSGALSSISSSLNSNAACAWEDLLQWKFNHLKDFKKAAVNKLLVLIFGSLAICMAFMTQYLDGNILQASNSLLGAISGPSLGMFVLGTFFPWTNWQGAFFGSLLGFGLVGWISVGAYVQRPYSPILPSNTENCLPEVSNMTESYMTTFQYTAAPTDDPNADVFPLYLVSYMYNSVIGTMTTIVTGMIISLLTGPTDAKSLDPDLIIPVCDKLCCCFPESWRRKFRLDKTGKIIPREADVPENGHDHTQHVNNLFQSSKSTLTSEVYLTKPLHDEMAKESTNQHEQYTPYGTFSQPDSTKL